MTWPDLFLLLWSITALGWWVAALCLLARGRRLPVRSAAAAAPADLTVFKPLPPVTDVVARERIARAVGSFVAQLDEQSTLLIGVRLGEVEAWRPFTQVWREHAGPGQIRILTLETLQQRANPKVDSLEQMAAHAGSGIWLWSDADVVAPPGLLTRLRGELASGQARAVTCAYCVREVRSAADALDALFVNLEFLPGALLLGQSRTLEFAFGAVVIFPAAEFQTRLNWAELGRELADDHALGRGMAPVGLSAMVVETVPTTSRMTDALKHYYRWQKTIRWCRPFGFAALLLILPLIGWTARLLTGPEPILAGSALAAVWLAEVGVARAAFGILGCSVRGGAGWMIGLWPALRLLAWLAVWLPLPVEWRGTQPSWRARRQGAPER